MKITTKQLMRNWEKIAFWCLCALFLVVLLAWLGGVGAYRLRPVSGSQMPPATSFLNPNTAFAFTKEMPPITLKTPSPFSHVAKGRSKPRPPEPPPTVTPVRQVATPKTANAAKTPLPPTPVIPTRHFEYLGLMTSATGKELALLRDADSGGTRFVSPGETMLGFKIQSCTDKVVVLRDSKGNDVTIECGQQKEFVVP